MKNKRKIFKTFFIYFLLFFAFVISPLRAADITSTNFIIRDPLIGAGSGYSSSTNFQVGSSNNLNIQGYSSSTNFIGEYGFQYYQGVVNPSIQFSISDTTIEFGPLSSSQATWADDSAGSSTDVAGHTMTIRTNAPSGYAISYNGPLLTSGGDSIDSASLSSNADGNPGTEEFGIGFSTNGDATITDGYRHADPDWTFVASTPTTVVSETVPTAIETISAYYIANISTVTPAGSYSTGITYIATGNF
jgi:hypothetical protein